jgi:hypothetical protein
MDESKVREWARAYDDDYDDYLHEIERFLQEAIPDQGYISKEQLRDVIEWKLDNQPGRQDTNIERVNRVPDEFIERVSEAALSVNDPKLQIQTLTSIPGIGSATATVVLSFYDPGEYAVGDQYMVDILFGEARQMRLSDYPRILDELRERNPGGFKLRTVEKAYYQRYRVREGIA